MWKSNTAELNSLSGSINVCTGIVINLEWDKLSLYFMASLRV